MYGVVQLFLSIGIRLQELILFKALDITHSPQRNLLLISNFMAYIIYLSVYRWLFALKICAIKLASIRVLITSGETGLLLFAKM